MRQRSYKPKPLPQPAILPPEPLTVEFSSAQAMEEAIQAAHLEERMASLPKHAIPADGEYIPTVVSTEIRRILIESGNRQAEALKLYEPMPVQAGFHECKSRVRIIYGSNRGGKTLAAAVEAARMVTGQDPYDKYPKADGRLYCVAKDMKELGEVMYRKLFRAGAFKIIKDQRTGRWRAYRPWIPADLKRSHETKPAPPLVPRRLVKRESWYSRAENQPSLITLHNGWEISFYSSNGKPPHGADIDGAWLDEEIIDPDWYPELSARCIDRRGIIMWSATPQAGTDQLFELHEQAMDQEHEAKPLVKEFFLLMANNSYIEEDSKGEFIRQVSEEEYSVRVAGQFAINRYRIYPHFGYVTHGIPAQEIPQEWTCYAAIDPGIQVCAVLFGAVPPENDRLILYDELYIKDCRAAIFGEQMAAKIGNRQMQSFVIDYHGSIVGDQQGKTIQQQYSDALRLNKVKSVETGYDFLYGSHDVSSGIMAVHSAMRRQEGGKARLQVVEGTCPNLVEFEMPRYHYARISGKLTDKPDKKKHTHLCDALRYLVMLDPKYIKPRKKVAPASGALAAFKAKKAKRQRADGDPYVTLGPGAYARR